jgi:hypothetical protein
MLKARLTGLEQEAPEPEEHDAAAGEDAPRGEEPVEIDFPWMWSPLSASAEVVGPYSSRLSRDSPESLLPFPNPDDLTFHPPRHYRLRPLPRALLSPASLRAPRPIVAWDNDVALEVGLLRHYRFDNPAEPAADSGPRGIDGIAVNLRLEPPRAIAEGAPDPLADDPKAQAFHQHPRLRLAQEGSQLVILPGPTVPQAASNRPTRSAAPPGEPARAVALHFTPLPGGQEPRGLLYEEGDGETGGFALWIADGRLHAVAQMGVSSRQITAELARVGSPPFHVVAQFHLGLLEIYVNGRRLTWQWADFRDLPAWQSAAVGVAEGSAPSVLTRDGDAVPPFLGLIADLRVYNRALNPVEIRHLARDYLEQGQSAENGGHR